MSPRQSVDQQQIEYFLRQLGKRFSKPGRIYFDLYSIALSKIARGTAEDFADVLSLLKTSRLEMEKLTQYFDEILPDFATTTLKRDPIEFKRKFEVLSQMWSDTQKTNSKKA